MIIALYGASCTGKSTIADSLIASRHLPIRRCGDEVRDLSAARNLQPDQLPLDGHREIDALSVAWVREHATAAAIIEGRFLDSVLSPVADLIRLIHVSAAQDIRAERWEARRPGIVGHDEVARQDRADEAFREWAYSGMARLVANMNVETDREVRAWDHLL
jgi:cytidylate kinase